jgi:hypothetical protein
MRISIFKPGTHRSLAGESLGFTEADLGASARAYDPAVHEAPLVIGHPKLDAPAYGWIGKVDFVGGEMRAESGQVDPEFAEMVKAGRFKKVSASFYRKGAAGNPKPEVHYLRHVGFLGAAAPAVKGLKAVEFAAVADDDIIEFSWGEQNASLWQNLREWIIEKFSVEDADRVAPPWIVDLLHRESTAESIQESPNISPSFSESSKELQTMDPQSEEQVAKQAELDARQANLDQREAALRTTELNARQSVAAEYAENLVKEGKILPRFKGSVVALLTHLPEDEIEFAEGDTQVKKAPVPMLRDFLDSLPAQIEYSELTRADGNDTPKEMTPKQIAKKARDLVDEATSKGRTLSYTEAVNEVVEAAASA